MFQLISLFVSTPAIAAAPDLEKGVTVHLERTVDASASRSWEIMGEDFVHTQAWSSNLHSRALLESEVPAGMTAHASAPFPGRVVTVEGHDDQIQVLVDFDADERTFTFRAGNPPKVVSYAANTHTIVDLGDGRSKVVIDVVLVPKGIAKLLKGKIEKKYTAYMKAYLDDVEAGITRSVADGGVL